MEVQPTRRSVSGLISARPGVFSAVLAPLCTGHLGALRSAMASTDVVMPVSLPTSAGTREVLDLGYPHLNLQKLDDPKARRRK